MDSSSCQWTGRAGVIRLGVDSTVVELLAGIAVARLPRAEENVAFRDLSKAKVQAGDAVLM